MGRIMPRNQHFMDEDGSPNFLVSHDWGELNSVSEDARLWITGPRAAAILGETLQNFHYLVNSGKFPHRYLKTNEHNYRGICIVPIHETLQFGIERLLERAEKELPELLDKCRKLGFTEEQLADLEAKHREVTDKAVRYLREGAGMVSKGLGGVSSEAICA
jgi:hypothetical protein